MSLLWQRRSADPVMNPTWAQHSRGRVGSTSDLAHSAAWAAVRLRADLVSSMPVDLYRRQPDGSRKMLPLTDVLRRPARSMRSMREWLYATQTDLDRYGNTFGRVLSWDLNSGLPLDIEPVSAGSVSVVKRAGGEVEYRFDGQLVPRLDVWHERQYVIPGLPVGLSPITFAAMSLDLQRSAMEFARDWFAGDVPMPNGVLRNDSKVVSADVAQTVKARFKSSVRSGEPFVTGKDWEFTPVNAEANDAAWLNSQQATAIDVARFYGVPSDLIDAPIPGSAVTYANIIQRNLQLLIMNVGPILARREDALASLVRPDQFVKLNSDAMLRMDPQMRSTVLGQQIRDRFTAPSEARALMDRPPFTDEQMAEFDRLFPKIGPGAPSLVEAVQKVYLGVGKVISEDEARAMLNEMGANLTIPGPVLQGGAAE